MICIDDIDLESLLGRAPASIDETAVAEFLRGRSVLVTGAGGSIGSELCRQIVRFAPARLVLFDRAEDNLFRVHQAVPSGEPEIGDVCDRARIETIFVAHRPDVVLHTAAYKHVPMMERSAQQAVRNNVIGTQTVADVASVFGANSFVMVSTDKAVNPSSVMGATKRLAEMYVRAMHTRSRTHFTTVRFGNVLGSAGSVVPTFLKQINQGGPVTVTHPDMVRYFMTIPEACRLILQAAAMERGGETFVLDMGKPLRVLDLAREIIRRAGRDVEIIFTGVRPGEKLVEELSREGLLPTTVPGILVGHLGAVRIEDAIASINRVLGDGDVRARLFEAVK